MSLSGSRLTTALAADILTALQSAFPVNSSLLTAEKSSINTNQQKMATAIANGSGADIVTEITTNAIVPAGTVTTGAGAGGTVAPNTVT